MTTQANPKLHISSHPLVSTKLTTLRIHDLPARDFREGVKAISSMLLYEASRSLPTADVPNLQSPISSFTGQTIPLRIGLSPILRAGIGMTDPALELFPDATVLHLGLFREKVSLQAIEYYSKLPATVTADVVFLLDRKYPPRRNDNLYIKALIATGNTLLAALSMLTDWGLEPSSIKIISILASRQGLENVQAEYPDTEIWVAGVDEELTEQGYVRPGLGDSGDRLFNTLTK